MGADLAGGPLSPSCEQQQAPGLQIIPQAHLWPGLPEDASDRDGPRIATVARTIAQAIVGRSDLEGPRGVIGAVMGDRSGS